MAAQCIPADDFLAIGQKLHIHWQNQPSLVLGKLTDIEEHWLAIAIERGDQAAVPPADQPLQLSIAGDYCVYRFTAVYQNRRALSLPLWYITRPQAISCCQERRFVRVPAPLPVRVRIANAFGGTGNAHETMAVNISGGGICFVALHPVERKRQVQLDIAGLPLFGSLRVTGEVCRCLPLDVPYGRIYHIGVCLEKYLSHSIQEKLVHCIFELQRNYLERGLLQSPRNK